MVRPTVLTFVDSLVDTRMNAVSGRSSGVFGDSYTPDVVVMRAVDRASLMTYLNDHLAASVAALKLIGRVGASQGESHLGITLNEFRRVVEREQQIVQRIVDAFDGGGNIVKKTMAGLGEFLSRLKIGGFRSGHGNLELLEAMELLTVGFCGRRSLWQTLERMKNAGVLRLDIDFQHLIEVVESQLATLELLRLDTAISALSVTSRQQDR